MYQNKIKKLIIIVFFFSMTTSIVSAGKYKIRGLNFAYVGSVNFLLIVNIGGNYAKDPTAVVGTLHIKEGNAACLNPQLHYSGGAAFSGDPISIVGVSGSDSGTADEHGNTSLLLTVDDTDEILPFIDCNNLWTAAHELITAHETEIQIHPCDDVTCETFDETVVLDELILSCVLNQTPIRDPDTGELDLTIPLIYACEEIDELTV